MFSSPIPWNVASSSVGIGILTEGWNLADDAHGAEEWRSFATEVRFATPFNSIPVVHVGITGFDMDQRDSSRITLHLWDITESGFIVTVSTWAASRVYAVEFQWLAIGA